jgi:WD40 repeat protein
MNKKSILRALTAALMLAVISATGLYAQNVEVFPQLGHIENVYAITFSPDGRQILSSSNDNSIKLWDVATGREIRAFIGHASRVMSVAFSPDGRQVLSNSGHPEWTIKLWDIATGREIRTFIGHASGVAKFSPDGRQVLSGSNASVKLWDVATGREIRTFTGHDWGITSIMFSPDGRQIVSGSADKTVKLWDVAMGKEIKTFKGHKDAVNSVALAPDGRQIVSGSADKTVKLWDVDKGKVIKTFKGHKDKVVSVAFSPDGRQVVSGSDDNTIKLWDVISGREIRNLTGDKGNIKFVAFSPDGRQVITISSPSHILSSSTIKLWDIATGREIRTFSGHSSMVESVAFSPDGQQVLSGSWDNTIKLWDRSTGRGIRTFSGHSSIVASVVFSPDGRQILSGSWDNTVKLWDVATGREIRTFSGHSNWVRSISFSPDGRQAVSGSDDWTVKLWDIATGRENRTFTGHSGMITSVAFSPDGRQVISSSTYPENTIKLWDATTGREIRTFSGHSNWVLTLSFSPDGRQVISGSSDRSIKLWDTTTGREIRSFSGHSGEIVSVSFSPDGRQILSGSKDRTVKLWDSTTGREIRTFSGHYNEVNSVSFSPDGRQILSGSKDCTARIWDVSTGKEIAQFVSFSGNDTQLAVATRGLTVETQSAATSNEGEWLSMTPDGYYQASPRGDRYLNVRINNTVFGIDSYRSTFYNPDVVQARLQGRPDPASKANVTIQQAANFSPPQVTIQSPANFSTTNTATANLSVAIVDQNQPIKNIKILVNGRLVGPNELSGVRGTSGLQPQKASLTVTGNQKTVNFILPVNLDPGRNIIEVVAFNGYSENQRLPVEVTFNAPAGQRPALPNLWILAVGVNNYQDSSISNLNYCVADAKGVISSLKAQEGRRYAKVNSLLLADGETLAPTADNIRKNLNFLDQAGERDVVLLFLAGHGVSDNAGKFLFLPHDTRRNANNTINEATTFTDSDIVKLLDRAGNLLVFIDACNSGGVDSDRLVRSLMETNAFVFTASRGTEYSYEDPKLGHGFFTYGIMEGLKGPVAAQAQGNVTVLSLSGFVSLDVPKRTDGKQNPKAYSLGFYDFPMAVIR